MSDPPVPFLAPFDLGSSPTPFDLSGPLPPPLLPQPAPSTLTRPDRPLFLGIDSGVDKIKACVLDEELRVAWTAKVDIDQELHEYGTRDGVRTRGDSVTCPSVVRLHPLDLLLTKLSRDCPDPSLLSRVVCVSGVGQPNAMHYLSPTFGQTLRTMSLSPHLSLSELFTPLPPSKPLFTVPEPTTDGDASTVEYIRRLETHFGQDKFDTSDGPKAGAENRPARRMSDVLEKGREELARRTGGRPCLRNPVAQLTKLLEDDKDRVEEEKDFVRNPSTLAKMGLLDRTERIVLESGLLASVFLGRFAPLDGSDACTTDMFNPLLAKWDKDILAFVAGEEGQAGVEKLEHLLGEPSTDGGKALGTISPYFVTRFGFSPACLISPFTGSEAAAALAYPLSPRRGDVLISLCGVAETDSLIAPVNDSNYATSQDWSMVLNPAMAGLGNRTHALQSERGPTVFTQLDRDDDENDGDEKEEDPAFFAVVQNRDAGIGRALLRDLYCNGKWDVFTHFSAISPHGGTIGIDEKYFAYFFPHREASLAQGFLRFVAGARTPEFSDRKINPRLLLESQAMTLRIGLGRLLRAMQSPAERARDGIRPFDAVGFSALSPETTAKRLVLVGEAAPNEAIASVVSSVFCAPAFVPSPLAGSQDGPSRSGVLTVDKTNPAALGTAYKAAWTFHRATSDTRVSFQRFLRRAIEATTEADSRVQSQAQVAEGPSEPSQAGTFASSSTTSGPPPSLLSLGGPDRSHVSTAGSSLTRHETLREGYKFGYGADRPLGGEHAGGETGGSGEEDVVVPGLTLMAVPDKNLYKYYASMLPEFVRLKRCALKGLV